MSDRLPPLTALRAFDAAARHMSFAKAAEELHVTPAALSFQIKSLEEHLGQPVFRRLNRAVELTDAGRALAPGASEGFAALARAWSAARRTGQGAELTVTAGPAFTSKWLAPRMFGFAERHPEIDLRFAATLRLLDMDRDGIDVAIRFGFGGDDGDMFSRPILRDWFTPIMTPDLAAAFPTPEALVDAPLLIDHAIDHLAPAPNWTRWFRVHGINHTPEHGPHFNQSDHAIDAALTGAGVVLGRGSLATRELLDGRLVAPFPAALTSRAHFRFICRSGAETRPEIAAFLDWLEAEAQTIKPLEDGRDFHAVEDIRG